MQYVRLSSCGLLAGAGSRLVFPLAARKLRFSNAAGTNEGILHAALIISTPGLVRTKQIQVVENDLTKENVDAVVNAANSWLKHGGGVAGAIVKSGGENIQKESDKYVGKNGPVQSGEVAVTGPGTLPCKLIIHAVGPVWEGGEKNEATLLHSAVWNALHACHTHKLTRVALPAISSGIFGFPKEQCADILFTAGLQFFRQHPESSLDVVRVTNVDQPTVAVFKAATRRFTREPNVRVEEYV